MLTDDTLREELYKILSERKHTENASVSDVTDGASYQEQRNKLGCNKHYTALTVGADMEILYCQITVKCAGHLACTFDCEGVATAQTVEQHHLCTFVIWH